MSSVTQAAMPSLSRRLSGCDVSGSSEIEGRPDKITAILINLNFARPPGS